MIKNNFLFKIYLLFIIVFWVFESSIHFFVFDEFEFELIPSDINELWMRGVITFLLLSFAIFSNCQTKNISKKENEKNEVYISMLNANQHILNNFLQAMMLFRLAADKSDDIDEEIVALYDKTIEKTISQINNLHDIQEPNKQTIEERFLPKNS